MDFGLRRLVADLSVDATAPPKGTVGEPADVIVTVSNDGPDPASAVTVLIPAPPGGTLQGGTGDGWTCTPVGDRALRCAFGPPLPSSGTAPPVTVTVVPDVRGDLPVTVTVSPPEADPAGGSLGCPTTTTVSVFPLESLPSRPGRRLRGRR